jgi:hypothetical protein
VSDSIHELVYDPKAVAFIQERWPQTVVTDASDFVHEGRSEVAIAGVTEDEFYLTVMREGWAGACFKWGLMARIPGTKMKVQRWLDELKAEKGEP